MFVGFLIGCFLLEAFSSKNVWHAYSLLGAVVILWTGSKLSNYPGLIGFVCPQCGHTLKPEDLACVISTLNTDSPKCGKPFFN